MVILLLQLADPDALRAVKFIPYRNRTFYFFKELGFQNPQFSREKAEGENAPILKEIQMILQPHVWYRRKDPVLL
jgi:hypothetical protein